MFAPSVQMNIEKNFQRPKRACPEEEQRKHTWESWTVRPVWLAIQFICFKYFQASTSAAVAAEASRQGQEGIAVANKERDVGEEVEDGSQHDSVGEPARAKQQVRLITGTTERCRSSAGQKSRFHRKKDLISYPLCLVQ